MKLVILSTIFVLSFSIRTAFGQCLDRQYSEEVCFDFEEGVCATMKWLDGPVLNKKSSFQLILNEPLKESNIKIYTYMLMDNGHHHGGPKMSFNEITPGVYQSNDARFFMGHMKGCWEVRVELDHPLYGVETIAFPVSFN